MTTEPTPPGHIAIIMDGNGRWARARGLNRRHGHRAGADTVREITRACARRGVGELTLFAFSTENWSRPRFEVRALMALFRIYIHRERREIMENDIQFRVIGRVAELHPTLQKAIRELTEVSAENEGMVLRLAVNYGGRQEILDAARALIADRNGNLGDPIEEEELRRHFYDPEMSDPDLVIRTAGEQRLSNFLLWQLAYSELWVTDQYWPDVTIDTLLEAFAAYQQRNRRFGGVS